METMTRFPRSEGKKTASVTKTKIRTPVLIPEDEQLFKTRKRRLDGVKTRRPTKTPRLSVNKLNPPSKLSKVVIETLTLSRLIENMIVYGCVQEVNEFELKFSITGGIVVNVPITNISASYSKLLEKFLVENEGAEDSVAKLSSMFTIGDCYPIKIVSKQTCDQFGHTEVVGSINPSDVYSNFSGRTVTSLPPGYGLYAAVVAKEDYGYLMDVGMVGVSGFLSFEEAKKFGSTLHLGQLVRCALVESTERSVTLRIPKRNATFTIDQDVEPSVYFYVPGVNVAATVSSVFNSGLELSLPGGYKGFVSRHHLSDDVMILPSQFKPGDLVKGHVLYLHPHTKQVCLSLKTKLTRKTVRHVINSVRIGLVIENAVVCARAEFGSLIFKLPTNTYAIALRKNLSDPGEGSKNLSIGTTHVCRVKKLHLFDNLVEVSLRKSFVERKEVSVDDLAVGSVVEGKIKKLKKTGVYVRLGFGLNGFIPNSHLTDAPMLNLGKNRDKLFPEGKSIRCRITRLDLNSRPPKIALTAKKTLISLDQSEVLSDFENISPGTTSTGVVCLINDKGILLEFFNWVRAFIPLKYLATYQIDHPEKVFQLGQLVRCTVASVDATRKHMVCSLIDLGERKTKIKMNVQITDKKLLNSTLEVGQILKKLKVLYKSPSKGLDLTNAKENIQVFLPLSHLSDDAQLCRVLFGAYQVGDVINQVRVFSKDSAGLVCVTRKALFVHHETVMSEGDMALKQAFPAVVRNVTSTGVFFEIPNSHQGVVRRKYWQDGYVEDPQRLGLMRGQTIFISPIEIALQDTEDSTEVSNQLKRFKFSMKLSDVWDKDVSSRIEMLNSYFTDHHLAVNLYQKSENENMSSLRELCSYTVGQVVTYAVTDIADEEIHLRISLNGKKSEPSVNGIALKYTDFGDLSVSQMGNAIVCDVDYARKALRVFIQPSPNKLVRHVKNAIQKSMGQHLKLEQSIKGTVIYIGPRYVLAVLAGHAPGVLAYVPSRRHYNDLGHIEQLYSLGQEYHFVVKNLEDSRVLAILNTNLKKNSVDKSANQALPKTNNKKQEAQNASPQTKPQTKKRARESISEDDGATSLVEEISEPPKAKKATITEEKKKAKVESKEDKSLETFDWEIPELNVQVDGKQNGGHVEEEEEEDDLELLLDSDSDEEHTSNKKKRNTREERNELARQQELRLRQKETELSNTERTPQDEQDFEMAVVASPNSSLVWLKYMAFYLEQGNVEQARAIGERALQRIVFREEKEKLNVWFALMNLENTYGDEKSMNALMERALQFNDPKVIYLQLANIYDTSNQKEKAEKIHNVTIRKFKTDPSVWVEFLVFFMKNQRVESARKLFQRALQSLETRHHIDLISKFAQLEFRFGDCEQGKTIFESLLATHWKRLDKWSIYLDMLIKYTLEESNVDTLDYIRNVFERLLTFKLPPFKMKSVFKKYYDFESKYSGDNVQLLERLQQKAAEYVESGTITV